MAYRTCCLLTESVLIVLLFYTVCGESSSKVYGYFNLTSQVTIPNVTFTLGRGTWIELSFRTCVSSGEILKYQQNGGNFFSVSLNNTSLQLHWSINNTDSRVLLGNSFNNNSWFQFSIKFFLGVVHFNVSKPGKDVLSSEILANTTFQAFLLDVRLQNVTLQIGRTFTGCLWQGPGVDFSSAGAVSTNVVWDQCPLNGQTGCSPVDSDGDDCFTIPCQHGGTCIDGFKNYTCKCLHNFNGTNCENDLRNLGCVTHPCLNNGTCIDQQHPGTSGASYTCNCILGFTGADCEVEIDECRSNPCRRGRCINLVNAYQCDCTDTGYSGPVCDTDVNECVISPCGPGTCQNLPGYFTCICPPGFAGLCQDDVDECVSSPCQNWGTCNDLVDGYNCTCSSGFKGTNCEQNIDDCVGKTCPGDNSRCEDLINDFQCVCKRGYTGIAPSCTDIDECASSPCQNNGTCDNRENQFVCSCLAGFSGTLCENDIDDCASNPCRNNATCSDEVNSFSCSCAVGFTGRTCSTNIDDCAAVNCEHSGRCVDLINDYRCECNSGWTGTFCEVDVNECNSAPCLNGGRCNNLHDSFSCSCASGYEGDRCEVNIDDCNPHPCTNNASCRDLVNDFFCNCSPEWMGKTCDQVFNACTFYRPCENNATCSTTAPSHDYNCTCLPGFDGNNCSNNIDDCVGVTCPAFEVCNDHVNYHTCDCPAGWTGARCETDIDECAEQPCQNGGRCINGTGFYTCDCSRTLMDLTRFIDNTEITFYTGWEGNNCELDINECLHPWVCLKHGKCENSNGSYQCLCGRNKEGVLTTGNNCELTTSYCQNEFGQTKQPPCRNGGTCIDEQSSLSCLCAPGFDGSRCDHNIDECLSNPCQYNGTCIDGINGYNCSCIPGITGKDCETNINECASKPCLNNGQCTDYINRYECDCSDTGFKGLNCETNIDDCIGVHCQHGGSCQDGIKMYNCDCFDGYSGTDCETDIDECLSLPCQNDATCLQRSNTTLYTMGYPGFVNFTFANASGYLCECVLGFKGVNCEINIDDCENNTCLHGATCKDGINNYTCVCAPGYTGVMCATEIDECEEHPCQNGATCTDKIADYNCSCLPFAKDSTNFGGKNCSVVLTGCDNGNRCQNSATCVPILQNEALNIHGYTCKCISGWTGQYCDISTTMTFTNGGYISKTDVSHLDISLRFRTTLYEALLVLYRVNALEFVAMEIHKGRLFIVYGNRTHVIQQTSIPSRLTVVDAEWHYARLNIQTNLTLNVESSLCKYREECTVSMSNRLGPVMGNNKLYIGNTDSSNAEYLQRTLSKMAYTGCMEDIILNQNYIIPSSEHVGFTNTSIGCPRTAQCQPYTCKRHGFCKDLWNQFACDCERPYLGRTCEQEYTAATFFKENVRSWASFVIPDQQRNELRSNLRLSLFVVTRKPNGVIMYLGNSNPSNLTFIALEMTDSKLCARVYLCNYREMFTTTSIYGDGNRHFVNLELISGRFTFTVNKTVVHSTSIDQSVCALNAEIAYFGGRVPNLHNRRRRQVSMSQGVNVADFSNTTYFEGVIQDIEMNNFKLQFFPIPSIQDKTISMTDSSNVTEGANSTQLACDSSPCLQNGTCLDRYYNDFSCVCPYGFRGKTCNELDFCQRIQCPGNGARCKSLHDGYECIISSTFNGANSLATYEPNISGSRHISKISLKLKTTIMYGTFLYIASNDVFLKLRIANEKLEVNYKTSRGISNSVSLHYRLSDGKQYEIRVMMSESQIILQALDGQTFVDEKKRQVDAQTVSSLISLFDNNPSIAVGGVDSDASWEKPYRGCLEEVRLGDILLPFFYDSQFKNYTNTETFRAKTLTALHEGCRNPQACVGNACQNGAVCELDWYSYNCNCTSSFTGRLCGAVDLCAGVVCQNGGRCLEGRCKCRPGYSGNRCEAEESCELNCSNNASCMNTEYGFTCNCSDQFTGQFCNVSVNQNCSTEPCQNGATCEDINVTVGAGEISSFNCSCAPGYTGPLCEVAVDFCRDSPCENGGNCTSSSDGYTCHCTDAYNGTNCETNTNCPLPNPCLNGGFCQGQDHGWICNCTNGWGGANCSDNIDVCNQSQPCQHGVCTNSAHNYTCDCTGTGYNGSQCELEVNECDLSNPPCSNNATCTNTEGNYTCNCTEGYLGHNCDIPSCNHSMCENNSTCNINGAHWECLCVQYYLGDYCEVRGPCVDNTCDNNTTQRCEQNVVLNNYTCVCLNGWRGDDCSEDVDECTDGTAQCLNGAACQNVDGNYTCHCVPGFTGWQCDVNVDDCVVNRCENGGRCIDGVNNYTCNCTATGYQGRKCSEDVDECSTNSSPCTQNEDCTNTVGSYTCSCKDGYMNNPCIPDPCFRIVCENGGSCNTTTNDIGHLDSLCVCIDGFQGVRCEKMVESEELNIWYIIGPILAIVLILIIIVVVVFLMVARTKRATRGTYSPSRQETSGSRVELGNVLKKPPEERLI